MDMGTIKALELVLILGVLYYFFRGQKRSTGKPDDQHDQTEQRSESGDGAPGSDAER
jgi:hypothetical protein